jgi:RNA polymerase sigma-70 factor (ECF subfamily)
MYLISEKQKEKEGQDKRQKDITLQAYQEKNAEELLALSIKNPEIFALIIDKYQSLLLKKAIYILKDEDSAIDIVQDTFVKIYLNATKFSKQENASFSSWAYKILLNTCFTFCKKKKRQDHFFSRIDEELAELIPDQGIPDLYTDTWKDELKVLISKLPILLKKTFSAYIFEGKSQKEIAEQEGISEGLVRARVHRAKKELQKLNTHHGNGIDILKNQK